MLGRFVTAGSYLPLLPLHNRKRFEQGWLSTGLRNLPNWLDHSEGTREKVTRLTSVEHELYGPTTLLVAILRRLGTHLN